MFKQFYTAVFVLLGCWLTAISPAMAIAITGAGETPLTPYVYQPDESLRTQNLMLNQPVRFFEGDVYRAYAPDFDDSGWEVASSSFYNPRSLPADWTGIRWYRFYLKPDSALFTQTFGLEWRLVGAAEVWLNGEQIYKSGTISAEEKEFEYGNFRMWVPMQFSSDSVQVLTVRHANPRSRNFENSNYNIGFILYLTDLARSHHQIVRDSRFVSGLQWFIVSFCLVFAIIHLIFFLFNRSLTFNLWFSLACFSYVFGSWVQNHFFFYTNVEQMLQLQLLMQAAMVLSFMFIALFLFSVLKVEMPVYIKLFFGLTLIFMVIHSLGLVSSFFLLGIGVLVGLQVVYLSGVSIYKKIEGSWLLGGGVIIFILSVFLVLGLELSGRNITEVGLSIFHAPYFGFGIALVCMSVFQSRHLAKLNMNLLRRLTEVRDLSAKNIEHERSLREAEVKRARLETENERKSMELEKARALQLSLLPAELPVSCSYQIHAEMFTATEVGGDYYDYIQTEPNSMIWATGDATGHGTDAGYLVAMSKTLFRTIATQLPPDQCLRAMSAKLKEAGIHKRYMCMGLLTIEENKISWCSAGIPALLIYRSKTNTVEQLLSKGMPLASVANFPYTISEAELQPGDVLLMMSDGLQEQMNSSREELGMERVTETFLENSHQSPQKIITSLLDMMKSWSGDNPQQDDITLVCMKYKENM